jgi:hypothetical protein
MLDRLPPYQVSQYGVARQQPLQPSPALRILDPSHPLFPRSPGRLSVRHQPIHTITAQWCQRNGRALAGECDLDRIQAPAYCIPYTEPLRKVGPFMKVAVLGAGAIGAYVGAALHRGGTEVHLIARGAHLEAIRANGVQVLSPRGDFTARTPATADPAEVGPVDYVFLGLKANSYATAVPLLEPLLHDKTVIVAAQNGIPWWYFHGLKGPYEGRRVESVDPGGAVTEVLALDRAVGCVVYCSTELEAPGVVRHQIGRASCRERV